MNDDELRLLIRAAIQRHMGAAGEAPPMPAAPSAQAGPISFGQYRLERSKDDTMCLIEPAVQCNHCGYCKCHGH
jgi:hypothetical protein